MSRQEREPAGPGAEAEATPPGGNAGAAARPPAARARSERERTPEPLRREVRLLGGMLGQVLTEAEGPELLADVERLRRAAIELRTGSERRAQLERVVGIVAGFDLDRAESVARAFTVYFQLANLAEEHYRVRILRERGRRQGDQPAAGPSAEVTPVPSAAALVREAGPGRARPEPVRESLAAAVEEIRGEAGDGGAGLAELLERLEVRPVLTAHPTEARRRAVVDALRRVAAQVERLDDNALPASEEAEVRRRLLEEISILWRTSQLRRDPPTPLDEVRAVMSVFDETLFTLVPELYRELDLALAGDAAGVEPPSFRPFLRWGSWVGGDRDGNPHVTAEVTDSAMTIQSEHVLRGLEAVTRRVARSISASGSSTPPSRALLDSLERDEAELPEAAAEIRTRAPDEPYRRKLTLAAARLEATRTGAAGAYLSPEAFLADLDLVQRSLVAAGAPRLAYGELQHLVWQARTFGFHLASLEIRQHASVHARALDELAPEAARDLDALGRLARDGWPAPPPEHPSPLVAEVLGTFRAMAELQRRLGPEACHRYVISFSRNAADLATVAALASLAVPDSTLELDVVPLFESRVDLEAAPTVLDEYLTVPGVAERLDRRGRRMEVMLGYSDSTKDVGFLAANVALYRAQSELASWARRHGVELTVFHGRGGALGRGGGPAGRAIRGQAPGSVAGRFKVTEQGEVIFARYGNPAIGRRHLEQVTWATLVASTATHEAALAESERRFMDEAGRMAVAAEAAYRELVGSPGFVDYFIRVTPIEELSELAIGSRPASRRGGRDLDDLRAIPWVFAWSQNRCNLPGWYGLGAGLQVLADEPGGLDRLRGMYAEWPFFTSLVDNAEMSLAKADPLIAGLYLELGGRPELTKAIREEFRRARALVLEVTGSDRLLARRRVLRNAVDLRNPYVDALSFIQVRFLEELRSGGADPERAARIADLVRLTVNGVAAGLQNTG
jgi:phosphoenolpyruvate carboxylase